MKKLIILQEKLNNVKSKNKSYKYNLKDLMFVKNQQHLNSLKSEIRLSIMKISILIFKIWKKFSQIKIKFIIKAYQKIKILF